MSPVSWEKGANLDHSVTYIYDDENNLSSMTEVINGVTKTYSYTYNDDNRLTSMTVDGVTVEYTYDGFGRLVTQTTKQGDTVILTEQAGYNDTATTASNQVVSYNGYTYTYDDNGNILSVSDGTNTTSYVYDSQNQLIRENNQAKNFTKIWTYDNAGNIQSRKEYTYTLVENLDNVTPTDTVSYGYNDDKGWGDLLTAYDGRTITYDEIGNPLNDGEWTYTWKNGRQLESMSQTYPNGTVNTWTYTYNANGMRTGRTCSNGYTYEYIYNDSQLSSVIINGSVYRFTYDASGVPLTMACGNETYYYVTNLQGDVTGIKNSDGVQVTTYTYDAWGKMYASSTNAIIMYNPLTYRGYVYDRETGLYYLQSRYYDPEIGRYINSDDIVCTDTSVIQHNIFSYCENNPVMGYDPTGHWNWKGFIAGVVIAAVGIAAVAVSVASGGSAAPVAAVAAKIAITAVGLALTGTGVVTSYAAATEKPMVIDVSASNGTTHDKSGYSVVIDFDTDSVGIDTYYHYGKTTDGYSASYGFGLVTGYEEPGDYGGYFIDGGGSLSYKGINLGLDICTDPSAPFSKCSAVMGTVGVGFSEGSSPVYGGMDYYLPLSYVEWG